MGESGDPTLHLPIDITFSKLADWLVDRKRIPADWRKRLLPIRAKIAAALPGLPKDLDSSFATLTAEGVGYPEAKHILNVLTAANPEARNLFGRLSGTAGDWDAIVRAYEKDLLFLGEAAQTMVQNVTYEIPYLKKQITKLQQQLGDVEKKETEYKRSAATAAVKYQQACQELGIKGGNVKAELLETSKNLPTVFAEVETVLCNDLVGQAIDCYEAFVSYAYNNEKGELDTIVSSLKKLRNNANENVALSNTHANGNMCIPEDLVGSAYSKETEIECTVEMNQASEPEKEKEFQQVTGSDQDKELQKLACTKDNSDTSNKDEATGGIDWDTSDGIQWDTGNSDGIQRDTGNSDGIQWDTGNVEYPQGDMESEIQWDINTDNTDAGDSGIQWDIDIEDGINFTGDNDPLHSDSHVAEVHQDQVVVASKFMETEYRNALLDDLLEIHTFLALKTEEINREETSSLQNQVQAISPQSLQQYGGDSFRMMKGEISKAIRLLTNKKIRDLIMIVTSPRFLTRLEDSLNRKKQQESKLLENVRELGHKQLELRSTLSAIWPKQEATLLRTKEIKEHCEKTISTLYDGRRINIIGEINSVLGQG